MSPGASQQPVGDRSLAYFRRAATYHGLRGKGLGDKVDEFQKLITRGNLVEPGIAGRIEQTLTNKDSSDAYAADYLKLATSSILNDGTVRRGPWARRAQLDGLEASSGRDNPCGIAIREEHLEMLKAGFEELPGKQRDLLQAIYFDGLSATEYSQIVGKPRQTISDDKKKAIQMLTAIVGKSRRGSKPGL
jgi:hypothetical protein